MQQASWWQRWDLDRGFHVVLSLAPCKGRERRRALELGGYKKFFLPALLSLLSIKTEALDCSHHANTRSRWTKAVQV